MADFDAFETAPSGEVDPAADFLAREQSELAGLEDDNFAAADSQPEAAQGFDAFGSAEGTDAPSGDQQNLADNGLGDFEMIGGAGDGQGTGVVDDGLLGGGLAGGSSDGLNSSATPADNGLGDFEMLGGGGGSQSASLVDDGGLLGGGGGLGGASDVNPPAVRHGADTLILCLFFFLFFIGPSALWINRFTILTCFLFLSSPGSASICFARIYCYSLRHGQCRFCFG
ncbi:uncharacterized PE-PGRS family protein PE_PGRS44 isoform X3 [Aplysia californica]|uniref:Uncharacterized PE-PGRS family protein PE_PGRS44 isoform X3 n=1 Tax=Aplysia californica TaxID=6500 RepID=A0ABM1VUB0_APLCA|nr:uncharacterized PE-PGRS family protein PE_PGRS44 isoform X3 [Aplysia californica]